MRIAICDDDFAEVKMISQHIRSHKHPHEVSLQQSPRIFITWPPHVSSKSVLLAAIGMHRFKYYLSKYVLFSDIMSNLLQILR